MREFVLNKIKYFEAGSQETPCFTAEIHVDGKLVAHVENSGHGGGNNVHPAKGFSYDDVREFDTLDVECDIFGLVYEYGDVSKLQSKGLVLKKDGELYQEKFSMPITKLKKHRNYKTWLDGRLNQHKKDGYVVLNRNL